MDETYFDEEPAVNFERAMLEISKDVEGSASINSATNGVPPAKANAKISESAKDSIPTSKDVSILPFRRLDVHSFFSDRNEVVEKALKDCEGQLIMEDEDVIGSWLLTEISLWDTEKERLILVSKKAIYSVKYDFISLNVLEYSRIPLTEIDTVVAGELVYPPASLLPKLSGLADGLSSAIHGAICQDWSPLPTCSNVSQLDPRKRHMSGIRLMWNKGQPIPLNKKWNPFAKNIPWFTFASHPLFWYKGSEADRARFDVEGLHSVITSHLPEHCNVVNGSIIVENYCGVGALVHNKNNLGFFKIRGKVSF